MDNKNSCLVGESDSIGIFKTLYLFLKNHCLPHTADCLLREWGLDITNFSTSPTKSILLAKCKCTKSQANQTERNKHDHGADFLIGTSQGETFQLKQEDTKIFYVCDHFKIHKKNSQRTQKGIGTEEVELSPRVETKQLKSKFSKLHDEHQKLLAITSELTNALQLTIIGQTKSIYSVLEQCKTIYPSLFDYNSSPEPPSFNTNSRSNSPGAENDPDMHPKEAIASNASSNNYGGIEAQKERSELILEVSHSEEARGSNLERSSQFPEEHQRNQSSRASTIKSRNCQSSRKHEAQLVQNIPELNLEQMVEAVISPVATPLTPETVRYILESVFERIFDMEKCKSSGKSSPPLNKDDVEKIVNEVLVKAMKSPQSNCGGGEGNVSRPVSEAAHFRSDVNFFFIDYPKLKNDLIYGDNDRQIRILQALRWRITKNDASLREKVLDSYIINDVLDLFTNISIPERILLGYGSDHYVQESACRLINTLASLKLGRDYLTIDDRLLNRVLLKKVKDVRTLSSAVIRNMLVATVQKLSIRRQCRAQMVNEGLFEIIVDYLDEFYDKLSKYCLEYCSALLMNLCLVHEAKERSTKTPKKIVNLLKKFLEGENDLCIPYLNGVMFSLFEKSDIVNEAINQNLDKTIVNLIQITNNESIKKQLDFILQSRLFGKRDTCIGKSDDDNKEEVDLLEAELDQDDFITQQPSGEKFLHEYKIENKNNDDNPIHPPVSQFSIKRDSPNSAKSFSEENKQFLHKPSSERGIFETAKTRRYTIPPQNLIKNYVKNKYMKQSTSRYPATPVCYMENCQKLQEGSGAQCSCSKCVPGQSRYSCGCYEVIRKDLDEQNKAEMFPSQNYEQSKSKSRW